MPDKPPEKMNLRRHDDDEYIDEIKISLVPRFKTSGMSGDEWRISAALQFFRKGHLVWERSFSNIKTAVNAAPWFLMIWNEGDEGKLLTKEEERQHCQQPGCREFPTRFYRMKKYQSSEEGDMKDFSKMTSSRYRWFCDRHAHRGDCGLEDCDTNYEVVGGGELRGKSGRG